MNDICCIGHITLDKIVTPKTTTYLPGGTSYYFSHAFSHLDGGVKYKLITSLAPAQYEAVDELREKGIQVDVIPGEHTVYFENIYGDNPDHRTQRVLAKADPFTIDKLRHEEARFFHLGSLLADDFSIELIQYLSTKGTLSVDAQGYLREVQGTDVKACDWTEKREALRYIHILKVNEHEAEILTGETSPRKAARILAEWGVKEVLLTLGSHGSLIYADGEFHEIPAYPPTELVDTTGCGDTYVLGYLYMRSKGKSYTEAGKFAAAISTLKLERSGPFSKEEKDIWKIIA